MTNVFNDTIQIHYRRVDYCTYRIGCNFLLPFITHLLFEQQMLIEYGCFFEAIVTCARSILKITTLT
jgi:hypothetical protein